MEAGALRALYNSTGGSGWANASSWLSEAPPCTNSTPNWGTCPAAECLAYFTNFTLPSCVGICCRDGAVTAVFLPGNKLEGTFPPAIWNDLHSLRGVVAYRNPALSGTLPTELSHATQLQGLVTFTTAMSGSLPTQLGSATALTQLGTSYSNISGVLPTQLGLSTALKQLYSVSSPLSGWLPTQLGFATALNIVQLYSTAISGSLPTQLGSATKLTQLVTSSTAMSGSLPTEIAQLTALKVLNLTDLHLTYPARPRAVLSFAVATVNCGGFPTICGVRMIHTAFCR